MRITTAKSAGFCYGVKRAVELCESAAADGGVCLMLGPVIHNEQVIARLASQGVGLVEEVAAVPPGARVILRSHGAAKVVHDALAARDAAIVDATCPYVSRIHRIVAAAEAAGRTPVIIGTAGHPEVQAIAGWSTRSVVLEDAAALWNWLEIDPARRNLPLTFVSQTTAIPAHWEACMEIVKKECTNLEIFDTICGATHERQSEAQDMAAHCDAMIVVGDRRSSNTRRLAELCRAACPKVLCVETAEDINPGALAGAAHVGITAGASTPGWIIKEVYHKMSNEPEVMEIEESFAELLEKSIKTLHTGEKVTGVITGITPSEIYVDLGTKHAGYIPVAELTDDPTAKIEELVKIGDEIETFVMRVNDQEGVVTLSKKRLDSVKSWEDIEAASEERNTLEGVVTEENKGGIVVSVNGVRVFVPASQTGLPREAPMSDLLKKKVQLRITEVNRARRRVVGSIRAVEAEARAAKAGEVWEAIEDGKRYNGVVKSLTSYGAFVDIGGVDGMVHISEMSWSRVKHPSEVVKTGDEVEVYVISFDRDKRKISLGMKDLSQNPWAKFTDTFSAGDITPVKIVKLMTFGAFAEIVPGVDGLIHISQIADRRINRPGDVLAEGDVVTVRITEIDHDNKKVSLSIRSLLEESAAPAEDFDGPQEDVLVAVSDEGGVTTLAAAFEEAEAAAEAPVETPAAEEVAAVAEETAETPADEAAVVDEAEAEAPADEAEAAAEAEAEAPADE